MIKSYLSIDTTSHLLFGLNQCVESDCRMLGALGSGQWNRNDYVGGMLGSALGIPTCRREGDTQNWAEAKIWL